MPRPVTGKPAIKGTRGPDAIIVTEDGVLVNGTLKSYLPGTIAGGFVINGNAGSDVITGGPGPDQLLGGDGNDWLAGTMEDVFDGGRGIDTLDFSGSPTAVGVDLLGSGKFFPDIEITRGSDGYLDVFLNAASEISGVAGGIENIVGSRGNDWLVGNRFENTIRGGDGDDAIAPGLDNNSSDQYFGEDGNDELVAGGGNDQLTGGAGADKFVFDPNHWDGQWVVHDYSKDEDDEVLLFPYSGTVTWSEVDHLGTASLRASFDGGDSITFVGITDPMQIVLIETTMWPA